MDDKDIVKRGMKLLSERSDRAYENLILAKSEGDREKMEYCSKQLCFYTNAVDALSTLDCMKTKK